MSSHYISQTKTLLIAKNAICSQYHDLILNLYLKDANPKANIMQNGGFRLLIYCVKLQVLLLDLLLLI